MTILPSSYNMVLLLQKSEIDPSTEAHYKQHFDAIFSLPNPEAEATQIQWNIHIKSIEDLVSNVTALSEYQATHLIVGVNIPLAYVKKFQDLFYYARTYPNHANKCLGMLMTVPLPSSKIEDIGFQMLSLDTDFMLIVHGTVVKIEDVRKLFQRNVSRFIPTLPGPVEYIPRIGGEPPGRNRMSLHESQALMSLADSRSYSAASSSESMISNPEKSQGSRLFKIAWCVIPHLFDVISIVVIRIFFPRMRDVHVLALGIGVGTLTTWCFKHLRIEVITS